MTSTVRLFLPFLLLGVLATATGCPDQGVVCTNSLSRCGTGCADLQSDERNCGGCGNACQAGQTCQEGSCRCADGSVACGEACVVLANNPDHCGACGKACNDSQVCEAGECRSACSGKGLTNCSRACVDLDDDARHCGACGWRCDNAQSCHDGRCRYDVVAACFTNGEVTGLQASSDNKGPNQPLGNYPAALASVEDVLVAADGISSNLVQARLYSTAAWGPSLEQVSTPFPLALAPADMVAEGSRLYVVNAAANNLQILEHGGGDENPTGLSLSEVGRVNFGDNTNPAALVKDGDFVYVALYGGVGDGAAAGQKVVKVNVSNPASAAVVATYDLSGLDLKPFSPGTPTLARPSSVAVLHGSLYVALNNLAADYTIQGPGMLARVDLGTGSVTGLELGASCLNAGWLETDGTDLFVSCAGDATYDENHQYEVLTIEKTGVVVVSDGGVVGSWEMGCAGAPAYDRATGLGCRKAKAGRLASTAGKLYVADQNAGRIYVLAREGQGLREVRGYASDAGAPVQACGQKADAGVTSVGDLYIVP